MSSLSISPEQTTWTADQRKALGAVVTGNPSESELQLLFHTCQEKQLDVFSKQVYAISRGGRLAIQVSIDGFRAIAARAAAQQGLVLGRKRPTYYNKAGEAFPFAPDDFFAIEYTVTISNQGGYLTEYVTVLRLDEYAQSSPFWKKMPSVMLAKCAEAVTLRAAFPEALGGLYATDEFDASDGKQDLTSRQPRRPDPAPAGASVSDASDGTDPFARPQGMDAGEAKTRLVEVFVEAGYGKEAAIASARQLWTEGGFGSAPISNEDFAALTTAAAALIATESDEEEVN